MLTRIFLFPYFDSIENGSPKIVKLRIQPQPPNNKLIARKQEHNILLTTESRSIV